MGTALCQDPVVNYFGGHALLAGINCESDTTLGNNVCYECVDITLNSDYNNRTLGFQLKSCSDKCRLDRCKTGYAQVPGLLPKIVSVTSHDTVRKVNLTNYTEACVNNITCPAGQYLPAGSGTCVTCPVNNWCPGDTFTPSASTDQGINWCLSGFDTNGATGRSEVTHCTRPCNTNDIQGAANFAAPGRCSCTATKITGGVVNGGGNPYCETNCATTCTVNQCAAGRYKSGNTCPACADGSYNAANNTNTSCSVCTGGTPAGSQKANSTTSNTCTDCTNKSGAATFVAPNWNNNNPIFCRINICNDGYTKNGSDNGNACTPNTFNVRYAPGNPAGTGSAPTSPTSCIFGGTCNAPANTYTPPTGQAFSNWLCSGGRPGICSGSHNFNAGQSIAQAAFSGEITLAAVWGANCVPVTLDHNGGTGGTPASVSQRYNANWFASNNCSGSSIGKLTANPTRPGHLFQGYYDTSASTGGTQVINKNIPGGEFTTNTAFASGTGTLYARWEKCPTGHVSADSVSCTQCDVGKHPNSDQSLCVDCDAGYFSPKGELCEKCPAGSYQDKPGQTSCNSCAAGSYQDQQGQASCNECPVQQYQDEEGKTTCKPCNDGTTGGIGAKEGPICKSTTGIPANTIIADIAGTFSVPACLALPACAQLPLGLSCCNKNP
ncbi:MAG: hypothetical protein FWG39_00235 [Alphaproteobacteria bacterium]|nr:hypothetical protein [Alphaproteobacteria bacterium]